MIEAATPFFHRHNDWLIPTSSARSPWSANALHGKVIVGILASEMERGFGEPSFLPARLTVDMYRSPKLEPLKIVTRLVQDGRRVRVIDAEMISDGKCMGRASCQMLLRTQNPPHGKAWHGETWNVPLPEMLPPTPPGPVNMDGLWDVRYISGRIGEYGQRRQWMRETRALVGDQALTPFARVAAGVDFVSPLANTGDAPGYSFVNSDLSLYLHRLPVGEWIGYETISHEATDGVGLAHCNLYDVEGRIGWGSACALAQAFLPLARSA